MAFKAGQLHVNLLGNTEKFAKAMNTAVKKTTTTRAALTKMGKDLSTLNRTVNQSLVFLGVSKGIKAVSSLTSWLGKLADEGDRVSDIQDAFTNLGGSTGSIQAAQAAVLGTVDAFKLMEIANQGLLRSLPDFDKNFGQIADLGARVAQSLGIDVEQGIQKVIGALTTAKPKQLESIGIFLDQEKAYKAYAESIGQSVDTLSKQQKTEALRVASMGQLGAALERLLPMEDSVAEAQKAAGVAMQELSEKTGIVINDSDELTAAWRDVAAALEGIDTTQLAENLATISGWFVSLAGEVIPYAVQSLEDFMRGLRILKALADTMSLGGGDIFGAIQLADAREMNGIKQQALDAAEAVKKVGFLAETSKADYIQLIKLTKDLESATARGGGSPGTDTALRMAKEQVAALADQYKTATGAVTTYSAKTKSGLSEAQKAIESQEKAYESLGDKIDKISGMSASGGINPYIEKVKDLYEALDRGDISHQQFHDALEAEREVLRANVTGTEDLNDALTAGKTAFEEHARAVEQDKKELESLAREGAGAVASSFATMASVLGVDISDSIIDGLKEGLAQAFPETMKGLSGEIMLPLQAMAATIADVFSNALSAYSNAKKSGWKTGNQIAKETLKGFESGTSGMLARGTLDILTGGGYELIRGKLPSILGGMFGSTNSQTAFRNGVAKWFDEAFDGDKLKLIIQGNLEEISSIDMSQYTGLDKFSADVQTTFGGIGDAIGAMLKGNENWFEGIGQQIAAALANTAGGSLLNLRVMLSKLKLSAEDLKTALGEDYLDNGNAEQYLASLRGVEEAYGNGIPGAIGATAQALDAFYSTAKTSGRYATQTLSDLGKEWSELNDQSYNGLRESLIASGKSAEEVDKIISALKANGITKPEDLINLPPEKVAAIVDSLDKMGLPLQEAGKSAQELQKTLSDITNTDWSTTVDIYYVEHDKPEEVGTVTTKTPEEVPAASARGNVFSSPALTYIAERGAPEAVLPLTRIGGKLGVIASQTRGGDGASIIHIDARGAAPGVENQVRRAISAMSPGIVAAAVRTMSDNTRRGR